MLNYLNKELQPYTNKEEYKKLYDEYTTSGDLFVHIDELTKKLVTEHTKLHETKSDSAYWGVMSNICLYEDLRYVLIAIAQTGMFIMPVKLQHWIYKKFLRK